MRASTYRRVSASVRVAVVLLIGPTSALAQTCTVSMPPVAFGNVNAITGAAVDTTSTVTVTCSGGSTAGQRVCISIGAGSANDATSRQLTGPGGAKTRYDLYKDPARTQLWGSWQTGYDVSGVQLDVPLNTSQSVTVYARFFGSQQAAVPGSYVATFANNPFIDYRSNRGANCPLTRRTASTSTSVTATVLAACTVSATNINFGNIGLLTGTTDAQGTLTIQCNSGLPYTVSLDGGTSGAINPTQRKMAFAGANVFYGLYRDAARTLPWGSTVGTNTSSGTGTGSSQTQTVYGRIAPQATPKPGAYTDTILVTVSY